MTSWSSDASNGPLVTNTATAADDPEEAERGHVSHTFPNTDTSTREHTHKAQHTNTPYPKRI